MQNKKTKILFIGLGNMGFPMACNLLKKGFLVVGFDLYSNIQSSFEKEGGKWVESLEQSAGESDIIISMLPGGREVEDLYIKDQKLFSFLKSGTLVIDCTTANPEVSRKVADESNRYFVNMLDAPVSGGTTGALQGTLTFIVGGKESALEKARPFLSAMGKNIFHAGKSGDGQAVKVCNNMLLAIHMIGTCEALNLGKAMGLSAKTLSEIMKASSGNNWSLEKYNPCPGVMEGVPSERAYQGGFAVQLMVKDLSLAMKSAENCGQSPVLGRKAYDLYREHLEEGFGKKDFSHIFKREEEKK